jgi:hypothetical protein
MIAWNQKLVCGVALSACMTVVAHVGQAGQNSCTCKGDLNKIKMVKQTDGSELLRLACLEAGQVPAMLPGEAAPQEEGLAHGVPVITEPRLLRALASVPDLPIDEGKNLERAMDPALVRSWAEVMDPSLVLGWKSFIHVNGFVVALLQRPEEVAKALKAGGDRSGPPSGAAPWVNTAVSTTWRNVVSEGTKRALTGQQALQEWLMLPTPEPKSNPWLSNLGSYRY